MTDQIKARGEITTRWVGSSEVEDCRTHNTLSYTAADVMAAAYGGDATRIPKYIGFLYGGGSKPAKLPVIDRDMDWAKVQELANFVHGNILVVRFSNTPSIEKETILESTDVTVAPYKGNVVVFHAVTRTGDDGEYAEDTSGQSDYATKLESGMYIYRTILLGDLGDCGKGYTVLGMADLKKNGTYRQKPSDYELAVDWRVTFN